MYPLYYSRLKLKGYSYLLLLLSFYELKLYDARVFSRWEGWPRMEVNVLSNKRWYVIITICCGLIYKYSFSGVIFNFVALFIFLL